jgi:hypothetical protein
MVRGIVLLIGLAAVLAVAPLAAQDGVEGQMYGSGVHAYFSQNYQKAYNDLSAAIKLGSQDPRVYYFRGLAFEHLGRPEEAVMDFQKGAELENSDIAGTGEVGRSLERIQGPMRMTIEKYRLAARLAAAERGGKVARPRAPSIPAPESRIPSLQPSVSPDEPATSGPMEPADLTEKAPPPAGGAKDSSPFAAPGAAASSGKSKIQPEAPGKAPEPEAPSVEPTSEIPEPPTPIAPSKVEAKKSIPTEQEPEDIFDTSVGKTTTPPPPTASKTPPKTETPAKPAAPAKAEAPAKPESPSKAEAPAKAELDLDIFGDAVDKKEPTAPIKKEAAAPPSKNEPAAPAKKTTTPPPPPVDDDPFK